MERKYNEVSVMSALVTLLLAACGSTIEAGITALLATVYACIDAYLGRRR